MDFNNSIKDELSLSLKNKNILITGVSRPLGIGSAIAKRLAEAGANVVIHGYSSYDMELKYTDATDNFTSTLANELSAKGFSVVSLSPSDISKCDEPERVITEAVEKLGHLDGLVLNHAYSVNEALGMWTEENIDAHFNTNVRASMLMIQAFSKQIKKDSGGAITLFTSGQYLGPMINEIAYAVSKEAIRGLCEQAAAALAPQNIRVNCINPGPTDTGYLKGEEYEAVARMFPSGRWGTPEDAARLVHFLQSDCASWITGQTIASEGGFRRHAIS
jgi:3-oxoacyl-[acyl-carrier protein] reductase